MQLIAYSVVLLGQRPTIDIPRRWPPGHVWIRPHDVVVVLSNKGSIDDLLQ